MGAARTKAERLEAEAKAKADRLEADARQRSQMLDSETAERRQQMFGELEKERDKLNAEVETLRSFEREYRSRLKTYFTQQLESLWATARRPRPHHGDAPAPEATALDPRRGRGLISPLAALTRSRQRLGPARGRPFLHFGRAVWSSAPAATTLLPRMWLGHTTRPTRRPFPWHAALASPSPASAAAAPRR